MSCGEPHEIDCAEVLAELWRYLDDECDGTRREFLQRHLDECGPCLEEFGIEEHLKALLARKCGGECAPDTFKERLRQSIRESVARQVRTAEVSVQHSAEGTVVEVRSTSTETWTQQRGQA